MRYRAMYNWNTFDTILLDGWCLIMSVVKNSLLSSTAVTFTIHGSVFVCVVSDNEYVNVNPLASSNSVFYSNAIIGLNHLPHNLTDFSLGGCCMVWVFCFEVYYIYYNILLESNNTIFILLYTNVILLLLVCYYCMTCSATITVWWLPTLLCYLITIILW